MAQVGDIFSVRLVIADFYMQKPTRGLDACYSEFRSKDIKRVPIIRVFGSTPRGQKTCMHVHGVFPYFYIPYEKKDFDSVNKAIYQIAINVDKAINISLGQSSSDAQHVFKVQLVKGIPFYGYHRAEHQFLKIYMFNPRFVRRAANLLQNGAILGKTFHPHESHVPYILQFMIDYNLYGMSFLHVPLEVVKFRRKTDEDVIPFAGLQLGQILSTKVEKKLSTCKLEVDVSSNFILNRFQMAAKSQSTHSNPGIESIWHDELVRRQKLVATLAVEDEEKAYAVPALEVPASQERFNVQHTESEQFYRAALTSKLLSLETTLSGSGSLADQTLSETLPTQIDNITLNVTNSSPNMERKRKFNLRKLLANAVYPEECTQDDQLVDASAIENHLSNNSIFQTASMGSGASEMKGAATGVGIGADATLILEDESIFLDDTILDENLILSLTQASQHVPLNASLREEDMELLDALQQLETNNDNANCVDLDSTLAPLSQSHRNFEQTPELLDKETAAALIQQPCSDSECDEDNDEATAYTHDFSMALDDIDELILKLSQPISQKSQNIDTSVKHMPQIDGSDDLLRTPTKNKQRNGKSWCTVTATPPRRDFRSAEKRSPRTPKTNRLSKYAPLPLIFTNRSAQKPVTDATKQDFTPIKQQRFSLGEDSNTASKTVSLRQRLASREMENSKSAAAATSKKQKESKIVATTAESINTRPRRSLRRAATAAELDETHITCALTPRRTNERLLRVYKTIEKSTNKQSEAASDRCAVNPKVIADRVMECVASIPTRLANSANERFSATNTEAKNKPKRTSPRNSTKTQHITTVRDVVIMRTKNELNYKLKRVKIKLRRIDGKGLGSEVKSAAATQSPPAANILSDNVATAANAAPVDSEANASVPASEDENEFIAASDNEESIYHNEKVFKAFSRLNRSFGIGSARKRKIQAHTPRVAVREAARGNLKSALLPSGELLLQTPKFVRETAGDEELETDDEQNAHIQSFYEISFTPGSPAMFSHASSPELRAAGAVGTPTLTTCASTDSQNTKHSLKTASPTDSISMPAVVSASAATVHSSNSTNSGAEDTVSVAPLNLPPTYEEAIAGCRKFDIHEYVFQTPHYSNPADLTKLKEVGHTVLRITGNKLNDLPEFESLLGVGLHGLTAWRRQKMFEIGGPPMLNRYRTAQSMREYFATQRHIAIVPHTEAPLRQEAKMWLKARELLQNKEAAEQQGAGGRSGIGTLCGVDEDSPIKVRRQKVTMMLNDENADADSDDVDCTIRSLTLTPLTPGTPLERITEADELKDASRTPLTSMNKKLIGDGTASSSRLKQRARMSLYKKLNTVVSPCQLRTSQSSDSSIPSQVVVAEMERSSFIKQLHSGSFAGSGQQSHELSFGLSHATLDNTFGFKVKLENLQQAKSDIEYNYLTILALEVFVSTRGDFYPNPQFDEMHCLFYAIEHSVPPPVPATESPTTSSTPLHLANKVCGYIMVRDALDIATRERKTHELDSDVEVKMVASEVEAVEALLELCARWDPDIFAGYEIEMSSWGYVMERVKYLGLNIAPLLSRIPSQKVHEFVDEEREQFTDLDFEMKLCGRILLDVWRLMRSEIALTSYTFENVIYHILHKRCPWHSFHVLTEWFASPNTRWIVLEYYLERVRGTLALLDQLDLIGRTSEMAKLIGIQFYEVLSRGSQFRVESMMLRIAKPKNLVPISPSVQQRAHMRAPEYLPLILEPQSRFYVDPVIVLDFQSLYPSMIIAYNYCFSTCLGRVEHLGHSYPFEFGASQLRVSPVMLRQLLERDLVTISPCGVVFVKSSVREGILPRMLTEILDTRQMVKQSMKLHKTSTALQRILHSRQLGLKLMANVTYGYTAANFSGRMPAVEVGDSVVAKGRETLERAIKLVEQNDEWKVKVVYGDTDSMFVLVPGRNRQQAFKIGEEIAEAVTKDNPQPVKLKLEKVYQPCILQTKKRYVGYMYEAPDQAEPIYEAKGIETVRRDGCPAVAKMLEKVLRILFETADVSQVKKYVCRQLTKLLSGKANLQDLIFAKEFRGLHGYKPKACVPSLELTRKWIQTDPRRIPRSGERVPFIIINGPPGVPLIRLVRSPHEALANEGYKINAIYYITKVIIPPLNRCLLLIGADVNEWFTKLPRKLLLIPALSTANEVIAKSNVQQQKKSTISQYFSTTNCITDCGRQTKEGLCAHCQRNKMRTFVSLQSKMAKLERGYQLTQQMCQACCGRVGDAKCGSLDCPVLYVLEGKRRDLNQLPFMRTLLLERF